MTYNASMSTSVSHTQQEPAGQAIGEDTATEIVLILMVAMSALVNLVIERKHTLIYYVNAVGQMATFMFAKLNTVKKLTNVLRELIYVIPLVDVITPNRVMSVASILIVDTIIGTTVTVQLVFY